MIVVDEQDEEESREIFYELVRRCGAKFVIRMLSLKGRPIVEVSNGPGVCTSLREPWMLQHLMVRPRVYIPCYLNPLMLFGGESIRDHLVADHGYSSRRVERLSNDNAYRVHDLLHENVTQVDSAR